MEYLNALAPTKRSKLFPAEGAGEEKERAMARMQVKRDMDAADELTMTMVDIINSSTDKHDLTATATMLRQQVAEVTGHPFNALPPILEEALRGYAARREKFKDFYEAVTLEAGVEESKEEVSEPVSPSLTQGEAVVDKEVMKSVTDAGGLTPFINDIPDDMTWEEAADLAAAIEGAHPEAQDFGGGGSGGGQQPPDTSGGTEASGKKEPIPATPPSSMKQPPTPRLRFS
jgi:hypothetical protein